MNFQKKQEIRVAIEATVAEGTGLAYHFEFDVCAAGGYTITHLASGRQIYRNRYPLSEKTAQCWIQKVAALADWQNGYETFRHDVMLAYNIDKALEEALLECPGDFLIAETECATCEESLASRDHFPRCPDCGKEQARIAERNKQQEREEVEA